MDTNKLPLMTAKHHRLTKKEMSNRVLLIVNELLVFKMPSTIIAEYTVKWDVTDRTITSYIAKARDLIATRPHMSTDKLISTHISHREKLLTEAEHTRDKLDILKDIAKLQGLDITRVEVKQKYSNLDDDKLIEVITNE